MSGLPVLRRAARPGPGPEQGATLLVTACHCLARTAPRCLLLRATTLLPAARAAAGLPARRGAARRGGLPVLGVAGRAGPARACRASMGGYGPPRGGPRVPRFRVKGFRVKGRCGPPPGRPALPNSPPSLRYAADVTKTARPPPPPSPPLLRLLRLGLITITGTRDAEVDGSPLLRGGCASVCAGQRPQRLSPRPRGPTDSVGFERERLGETRRDMAPSPMRLWSRRHHD